MDVDDPWSWPVDRVVLELCTEDRTWQPNPHVQSRPDQDKLKANLIEQEIIGSILLTELDDNVLKDEFGIKIRGQRHYIRGAIEQLRAKSAKYHAHVWQNSPISPFGTATADGSWVQTFTLNGSQPRPQVAQTPSSFFAAAPLPINRLLMDDRSTPSTPSPNVSKGSTADDVTDQPGTVHGLGLSLNDGILAPEADLQQQSPGEEVLSQYRENPEPEAEPQVKPKKRIAPILVTSHIDPNRDREIPTNADHVVEYDPSTVEPGIPFTDEHGKKRLVPIHQPVHESEEVYDYRNMLQSRTSGHEDGIEMSLEDAKQIAQKSAEDSAKLARGLLSVGYLGRRKMTIDEIFYHKVGVGKELFTVDPEQFFENPTAISSGRRLYVHRAMKHFLQADRQVFNRDGNTFVAVQPYPVHLAPRFQHASFTLYSQSDDGHTVAQREHLTAWPEIDPEAVEKHAGLDSANAVAFKVGISDASTSYGDDFDPEHLNKYRHLPGGDEILPLYGESDEENEYDLETWKEIEEELGELKKPEGQMKRPLLSPEAVHHAIRRGIENMVDQWHTDKLPKKQQKAYGIWKRSRKRADRERKIEHIRKNLENLNTRIPKLIKEIAAEMWSSEEQVQKQTRIMEPSIFDREAWHWELSILEKPTAPPKPLSRPLTSNKSVSKLKDCEDGESIGSVTEASSLESDLDSFVVDDTPGTQQEFELSFADSDGSENGGSHVDEDGHDLMSPNSGLHISAGKGSSVRVPGKQDKIDVHFHDASGSAEIGESLSSQGISSQLTGPVVKSSSPGTGLVKQPDSRNEAQSTKLLVPRIKRQTGLIDLTLSDTDDAENADKKAPGKAVTTAAIKSGPIIISDTDDTDHLGHKRLPPNNDPKAIAKLGYETWETLYDAGRLVTAILYKLGRSKQKSIIDLVSRFPSDELWQMLKDVIHAVMRKEKSVPGIEEQEFQACLLLMRLLKCFADCRFCSKVTQPHHVELYHDKFFSAFYQYCSKLKTYFKSLHEAPAQASQAIVKNVENDDGDDDDDDEEAPRSAVKRRRLTNTTENETSTDEPSQSKKRKKLLVEDADARAIREQNQRRITEQAARREELRRRIEGHGQSSSQHDSPIINMSKLETQGIVRVHDHIARKIKAHQIEGVRFMWNQIITDEANRQGCLLAHTMGLGKTMQVITLLVAIAEASASTDETIWSQIPMSLRQSRTLVLCPPSLIDNWYDELLMWVPGDLLGVIYRLNDIKIPDIRLYVVNEWFHGGGVLILGYTMFQNFIDNKASKAGNHPLDHTQHEQIKKHLLEGANIIIADEAHKMKNAEAKVTKAAASFKSTSRIALTGSPLANNVEEYHSMINWVSPNYLGPIAEFRAKYGEPIQTGLYSDSTKTDRRRALKMLGVLNKEVEAKVHRAGLSVLSGELPLKQEFVITVPLTKLQHDAYSIYIQEMTRNNQHLTKEGNFKTSTIWTWIAVLTLLCNHPKCFIDKINERQQEAQENSKSVEDGSDEEPDWKQGASQPLVERISPLFKANAGDLDDINMSYKTIILFQILDAAQAVGDKVLIFSRSIPTLKFLEILFKDQGRAYSILTGATKTTRRQGDTKAFNEGTSQVYLISTTAGGLGLNLPGANRVVIFDFGFNPIAEEQAIGRAYRLGQEKPVFVYRLLAGGSFESLVHNKAVFKTQLAARVVDKKNPIPKATNNYAEYLVEPKTPEQHDLSVCKNMDPSVLDRILETQNEVHSIRQIVQSDSFEEDDPDKLTAEEQREVAQLIDDEKLKRFDPAEYARTMVQRDQLRLANIRETQQAQQAQRLEEIQRLQNADRVQKAQRVRDAQRAKISANINIIEAEGEANQKEPVALSGSNGSDEVEQMDTEDTGEHNIPTSRAETAKTNHPTPSDGYSLRSYSYPRRYVRKHSSLNTTRTNLALDSPGEQASAETAAVSEMAAPATPDLVLSESQLQKPMPPSQLLLPRHVRENLQEVLGKITGIGDTKKVARRVLQRLVKEVGPDVSAVTAAADIVNAAVLANPQSFEEIHVKTPEAFVESLVQSHRLTTNDSAISVDNSPKQTLAQTISPSAAMTPAATELDEPKVTRHLKRKSTSAPVRNTVHSRAKVAASSRTQGTAATPQTRPNFKTSSSHGDGPEEIKHVCPKQSLVSTPHQAPLPVGVKDPEVSQEITSLVAPSPLTASVYLEKNDRHKSLSPTTQVDVADSQNSGTREASVPQVPKPKKQDHLANVDSEDTSVDSGRSPVSPLLPDAATLLSQQRSNLERLLPDMLTRLFQDTDV